MDQLLTWDEIVFLWLNTMGSTAFDPFWLMMSDRATNVFGFLSVVFFYGRKFDWRSGVYLFFWLLL